MTLIKTSLLSGIAVLVKLLTLLGINKILAIYVGPGGYATLGQFQNVVQMVTTFASGAINTGVTRYTAEFFNDEAEQHKLWKTAGTIAVIGSSVIAAIIAVFNRELAEWLLRDARYNGVFLWFSATLLLFTFNTLLMAILNGKKEIGRYVLANICGSVFALIVTSAMAIGFGLYGALVALAVYQSLTFFITLYLCKNTSWFKFRYLFGRIDKKTSIRLVGYTAMALTSAICVPLSHILVRNHLGATINWSAAGYWEAVWRLSSAYLMLITSTLSVYYLPRLSELHTPPELIKEIIQGYKMILPFAIITALIIYSLRNIVISVLFTADFAPIGGLLGWQLMGDILKVGSWILSYVLLSKAKIRIYILTEIFSALIFYGLCIILVNNFGLVGTVYAHILTYLIYWAVLISILYYEWKPNAKKTH